MENVTPPPVGNTNQEFTPAPDNHLTKAILTMIFCCLPFGIVSLIYATKVEGLWAQGLRVQAQQAADNANKWANVALICGAVVAGLYLIYVILIVVGVAAFF